MKYHVRLRAIDDEGREHHINQGIFDAETSEDAQECAMQAWWDPRLDSAGCSVSCDVVEVDEDEEE